MNDRQHYRSQMLDLLRAEFDCAGQLHATLTAEAEALASRDVDRLERLVGDKQALMQTFEALELRKQQILEQTGFSGANRDIEACIDWCDDRGQLKRGWHLLLERIRRCQQQNRINGATLDSSRRHAQQALAILRGQPIAVPLYNPTGSTALNEDNGRSLAKA
ncbi:MAG: flagellar protein FlgN [Gammaproteobacteria bacterium]|nr:flagellar protein FlgN [Gammaproteobacteria bacterium]